MNPGISVTLPRSIVFASGGTLTDAAVPTAVMVLSVTTTTALLIGAAPVPSINLAAFRTTVPFPVGASGVIRLCGSCEKAETGNTWIRSNVMATHLKFFTIIL
jgi:hypothetical protein